MESSLLPYKLVTVTALTNNLCCLQHETHKRQLILTQIKTKALKRNPLLKEEITSGDYKQLSRNCIKITAFVP